MENIDEINNEKTEESVNEVVNEAEEIDEIPNEPDNEEHVLTLEEYNEELKKENKELACDNKKIKNELEAYMERLQRVNSEYDNYRKRTTKEKECLFNDACEEVLKNMFPVMDSLEMALKSEGSIEDLKKGIQMTVRIFEDALKKLGVEEIPTSDGFDPNIHNAVMHVEDNKYDKNEIADVFQKGYRRENKVLRFSMVKVAN